MSQTLTIVMYHYVRDLARSRYPDIKGLTIKQFREQIGYMARYYTFVTVDHLIASMDTEDARLPSNAAMLTFDDGYIDHYLHVFPILSEYGIQGCFFPVAKAVTEHRVLDVNKIHFVLASVPDKSALVADILSMVGELRSKHLLRSDVYYYQRHAKRSRFDPPEVMFVKNVLQKGLPEVCRTYIADKLFRKYVTDDEESFAGELYMDVDQLRCMRKGGMHIGSHGYEHHWLNTVSAPSQKADLEASFSFLAELGCEPGQLSFNYPYGAHNQSLVSLLEASRCRFGLTTKVGIADLDVENPLMLPRLDTNDLPKDTDADPNEWTLKVFDRGRHNGVREPRVPTHAD